MPTIGLRHVARTKFFAANQNFVGAMASQMISERKYELFLPPTLGEDQKKKKN